MAESAVVAGGKTDDNFIIVSTTFPDAGEHSVNKMLSYVAVNPNVKSPIAAVKFLAYQTPSLEEEHKTMQYLHYIPRHELTTLNEALQSKGLERCSTEPQLLNKSVQDFLFEKLHRRVGMSYLAFGPGGSSAATTPSLKQLEDLGWIDRSMTATIQNLRCMVSPELMQLGFEQQNANLKFAPPTCGARGMRQQCVPNGTL